MTQVKVEVIRQKESVPIAGERCFEIESMIMHVAKKGQISIPALGQKVEGVVKKFTVENFDASLSYLMANGYIARCAEDNDMIKFA